VNIKTIEVLYTGQDVVVYRGEHPEHKEVAIKMLRTDFPSATQEQHIHNEFDIGINLNSGGIRKILQLTKIDNKHALILELIDGKPIKKNLPLFSKDIRFFLETSIKIAAALNSLHEKNIIHKDLNSNNILLTKENEIKIIDLGISSKHDSKKTIAGNPINLEGTLEYISPEQTGRMNRKVDQGSDLYSLGVIMYEMLTGELPFRSEDPFELVHFHIAQQPVVPSELNSQIPIVISKVILKLLSKNAEDRYQSAFGLKRDLELINKAFPSLDELLNFKPAQSDFSSELTISEKLYGRTNEIKLLAASFERVVAGAVELVYLDGGAGVGKSSLIHELNRTFSKSNCIYLEGKFEQFDKEIPYSALIKAFAAFIELVLNETEENLDYWKSRIRGALGNVGKVVTDVFPELETLIGGQTELPELSAEEAKNRFNLAWVNLLKVISSEQHPLVLFIDDLQWADLNSVELIRNVLNDNSNTHLLCIVAMRSIEESDSLPIQLISETEEWVSRIRLENLTKSDIKELVVDTLDVNEYNPLDPSGVSELAEMIYSKTSGNIFFAIQLLESLFSQGLISFNKSDNKWTWEISKIRDQNITNNVVDLITKNLFNLPDKCLKLLQSASGKGNTFSLDFLCTTEQKSETEVEEILEGALTERIIVRENRQSYRFIHDRVLSAVYGTIEEDQKKFLHLKIGRYLKDKNENLEKHELFEITNHFNQAIEIIEESEKDELQYLNFISGRRAMKSVAYEAANNYFSAALNLKGESFWKENYEFCLELHNAVLIPSFSIGKHEWTETIYDRIVNHAVNKEDKTYAYLAKLNSLIAQGKFDKTNEFGLKILKEFGIKIPKKPNLLHVLKSLAKAKMALRGVGMKDIPDLPKMENKEMIAVMKFLDPLMTSSYLTSLNLNLVVTLTGFIQTIKFGYNNKAAYYITTYGAVLTYLNKIDQGYEFGQTGLEIIKKRDASRFYGKEYFVALIFTIPFKKGLTTIYRDFTKIYENCLERGDLETAGYTLTNYYFYKYYSNGKLTELVEQHSKELETFKKINQSYSEIRFKSLLQFADDVTNEALEIQSDENKYFSDSEREKLLQSKDLGNIGYYFVHQIHLNFLKKNYAEAVRLVAEAQKSLVGISGTYILSIYYLYSSLAILSNAKKEGFKVPSLVKKNQKKLLIWAKFCPENFQHKYDLVSALIHQKQGNLLKAKELFELSISGAKANEFISEESVAWELGAELYHDLKIDFQAEFYIQNAYQCYKFWGASGISKQIEKKYPGYNFESFIQSVSTTQRSTSSKSESGLSFNRNMDLNSVIKASQSISREVKQEGLLKSLMLTIMENAGAQHGLFIQNSGGKLKIEADCSITRKEDVFLGGFDISKFNCPQGLIRYVMRTKKELVLNNALTDDTYRNDEYIQSNEVKSVLCFPVIHKNNVIAVIYLENNLGTHAFTKDHLDTVRLLSSQIAISLENADLYQSLEKKVEDRTQKLNHAHNEIKDSILYAKRIQTAILPQPSFLAEKFKNGFVLFRPKDVVSGDFFWFKEVGNYLLFAAADCTGHGVPGAMVSVICNSCLNRSVREFGIVDPGILLDKTKELVIEVFSKSEQKVQDGMDISLCALNLETGELKWAGANNSIYCIKKIDDNVLSSAVKNDSHYLHEIKPNVQPIGIYDKNEPFTTHTVKIEKGDMIYLFTDGYSDQFGGPKRKKLKSKNFKKMLVENFYLEPEYQKIKLNLEFDKWRGEQEQLDDVCVIGLRI